MIEKNIEHLLEKYFSEYKEYHIWAIVILGLIFVGFQIAQTIIVSTKIEKFIDIPMMLTPHSGDVDPSVDFGLKNEILTKLQFFS